MITCKLCGLPIVDMRGYRTGDGVWYHSSMSTCIRLLRAELKALRDVQLENANLQAEVRDMARLRERLAEYGGQRCTAVCRNDTAAHWCLRHQGHGGKHIWECDK